MITITRRQARRLRGIFRRSALGITHRGTIPPLIFTAGDAQLRARHRYAHLAVEYVEPASASSEGTVTLPLDALADVEGRDDSPVVLEATAHSQTVVRWEDHGIPQTREYEVTPIDALAPFPEAPASLVTIPSHLLTALVAATETSAEDTTRYALNCVQLRGATGEIIATDGRQLLVQGGFPFPWDDDVLVRRSPIFAGCKGLAGDGPLSIGKTDTHVVLRVGPWTLSLEIATGVRFPRVEGIVPEPDAGATRLRLDPGDASFLAGALDRLPAADELNAPATLDLNGKVAVRVRGCDQERATELILSHSRYAGTPLRLHTNRAYLARAIRLGFAEVEIAGPGLPLVCRDEVRRFAWQPLPPESALAPADDVIRIESDPATTPETIGRDGHTRARTTVSERTIPSRGDTRVATSNGHAVATEGHTAANGHAVAMTTAATGLAALIQEAEALHEALGAAKARAGRLVVALRRHRKQARLMSSTIAALKQLKLQEVAE